MRNKKAFTLIELLAVIIILGLLLAIAIPMVSRYIDQSRKKTHITTAQSLVDGLTKEIVSGNIPDFYNEDTLYYVPFSCIPTEKGGKSPHGSWEFAYVIMSINDGKRTYYVYTKDNKGEGIDGVDSNKLKTSDIKAITKTKEDGIEVEGKNIASIVDDNCNFENVIVNSSNVTPADSCFDISAAGVIENWNVSGHYNYTDNVYVPAENDSCYTAKLNIPATINGITVTGLGFMSFSYKDLTSITLPNTIVSIGDDALSNNKLSSITLPNSLKNIFTYALAKNLLTSVTIPNGVISVEESAFFDNKLTSLSLPNSLTEIGLVAFAKNQLTSITIPSSVTIIDNAAFGANKLTNVNIVTNATMNQSQVFCSNPTLTAQNINYNGIVDYVPTECESSYFIE